ncbi:MAG: AMP-binding protein, partial [bacterium]|nr:AMP-binding protein [bacterium]
HIISDGVSEGIFIKEFMALYEGRELPPLRLQYKDFSQWQNRMIHSGEMEKQEQYWAGQYAGEIPVLQLPTDFPRPPLKSFEGELITFQQGEETTAELKKLALHEDVTLFMLFIAIYNIFLSKICGQEEIVVGTPIAGRNHFDLLNIMGMFVNTLALRNRCTGHKTLKEYLKEVKENTLEAFENQDYQFEELVDKVVSERDTARNPLFNVMFVMENVEIAEVEVPQLKLKAHGFDGKVAKFDLTLKAKEKEEGIKWYIEYSTKLFKQETIERFIRYFKTILSAVIEKPEIKISEIEIISAEEKEQLVYRFNDTHVDYPANKTITRLFEEQVEKTPESTALIFDRTTVDGGAEPPEKEVGFEIATYRQLNEKANRLARTLIRRGVNAERVVGIMVERSMEMVLGMLAIMKAGGAYLPIDPQYPRKRKTYMIKDSGLNLLLVQEHKQEENTRLTEENDLNLITIEDETVYSEDAANPGKTGDTSNLAYVIYTSGTTGKPKGVMVEHRSIVNTLTWRKEYYTVNEEDVILQLPSYSFDSSVEDIFTTIISGAALLLIQADAHFDLRYLREIITRYKVTHFLIVPGLYRTYIDEIAESLKTMRFITVAGDDFTEDLVDKHLEKLAKVPLYNEYGPA